MPSKKKIKKNIKKKITKNITKKKFKTEKKVKKSLSKKKSDLHSSPLETIFRENEIQLTSLILKDFDKELSIKAKSFIKSYSRIHDSIITTDDFLNYIENLDEDLYKLFKAYSSSPEQETTSANDETEEEEKSTGVKSDDPVRMYLKEMGNVELLSREGEIAIAKRIESGLDKMMNSILECPASIDILKKWDRSS